MGMLEKQSETGEAWRTMVERDHQDLRREWKKEKFMMMIAEFPNNLKSYVVKLESYVKTLKDAHSKRIQARGGLEE